MIGCGFIVVEFIQLSRLLHRYRGILQLSQYQQPWMLWTNKSHMSTRRWNDYTSSKHHKVRSPIARVMGPTWGPPGADRSHVSHMNLAYAVHTLADMCMRRWWPTFLYNWWLDVIIKRTKQDDRYPWLGETEDKVRCILSRHNISHRIYTSFCVFICFGYIISFCGFTWCF